MTALHKPLKRQIGDLGLRGGDAGEYVVTLYPGTGGSAVLVVLGKDEVAKAKGGEAERARQWDLRGREAVP